MKMRNLVLTLGFMTASLGISQGPLYDKIKVDLQYPVTVNGTVLPPGNYEIKQHESAAGGSRILRFFSDGGMKLETTAMAIAALDNKTQTETRLVLEHIGPDYFLNKVWVQGKDYGYEFPIPDDVKRRELERSQTTVVGRFESGSSTSTETNTTVSTQRETSVETTQSVVTTPVEETRTTVQTSDVQTSEPVVVTENRPAEPVVVAQIDSTSARTTSTNQEVPSLPATAGNWLSLLLGGGCLTGAGICLRRLQA